eukprot:6646955-Lingulodinium_polyedra.AAC.1
MQVPPQGPLGPSPSQLPEAEGARAARPVRPARGRTAEAPRQSPQQQPAPGLEALLPLQGPGLRPREPEAQARRGPVGLRALPSQRKAPLRAAVRGRLFLQESARLVRERAFQRPGLVAARLAPGRLQRLPRPPQCPRRP